MRTIVALSIAGAACSGADSEPPPNLERHPALIGLWVVDQPNHALYESTQYEFRADGVVVVGPSFPDDCSGHLAEHCVTGSVGHCPAGGQDCASSETCVFGSPWASRGPTTLIITGDCFDGVARPIEIALDRGADVVSVGGETGWSHNNWDWAFRKCDGVEPCGQL